MPNLACLCREAQLEKKAARREATKEREQSPDMSKLLGGGDIMGGDDSFAAAKARSALMPDALARKRQSAASECRVQCLCYTSDVCTEQHKVESCPILIHACCPRACVVLSEARVEVLAFPTESLP